MLCIASRLVMVMAMSVWLLGWFAVSPCVVVCCFWILARYAGHTVYAVLVDLQCFVSMGTYSELAALSNGTVFRDARH